MLPISATLCNMESMNLIVLNKRYSVKLKHRKISCVPVWENAACYDPIPSLLVSRNPAVCLYSFSLVRKETRIKKITFQNTKSVSYTHLTLPTILLV